MTQNTQHTIDAQIQKDPGQIVPPRVDTSIDITDHLSLKDLKTLAPAGVLTTAGVGELFTGNPTLGTVGLGAGAVAGVGAIGMTVTNRWYNSPRERVADWYSHIRSDDENTALADVTGVAGMTDDGLIEMADGRVVGLVRVDPQNAALLDDGEQNSLAASLSSAIDEQVRDIPFRIFSTTRDEEPGTVVAQRYEERALGPTTDADQSDVLLGTADWLTDGDIPNWNAREWKHYVAVDAAPSDALGPTDESLWDIANPLVDTGVETVSDEQVWKKTNKRVQTVVDAINSVGELEAERVEAAEALSMARNYWGRTDEVGGPLVGDVLTGETEAGHVVNPETFDEQRGWVDLGDEFARTLWIAEYPTETESMWLSRLTSIRGINVDLCVNADPVDKDAAIHELSQKIADVGSEGMDRQEDGDVTTMDVDDANDANVKMRKLLRDTPSQPWDVSTYVVVRADNEAALNTADETLSAVESFDGAKHAALDEAEQDVRDLLTTTPANVTPIAPSLVQGTLLRSASPLTTDVWNDETPADKSRRVPGAVIGSMFPFCGVSIQEESGMDWGRNEQNGSLLRLSPFERGGAPHQLTIGQTRAGKTYSASKAAMRWWLERDGRTLITIDTQQGFDGVTRLCNGKHIEVDASQSVNPLRITAPSDDPQDCAREFRMTVEETVAFLTNLLRSDGVDNADEFAPILSQAAESTLSRAGIDAHQPETFNNGNPNLSDFIDTLIDMNESPEKYTWSDDGHEVESHKTQVGELLTKLRSFQEGGKYEALVGEDEIDIVSDDVEMAYLDLHSLSGSDDAEKSAMLMLMLSQVREKIKAAPGETVLMLDEAHVLLDNPRTANWLQKAAREFARYDASLWFLSQSPKDFVSADSETDARDTIRGQCGMVHIFRTPAVDDDVLAEFGLNQTQREFVREKAVRGKSGRGYSECLIYAEDIAGWIPTYVETSPAEDAVLSWSRDDGDEALADHQGQDRTVAAAGGDD
ncbi:transfer complex protein [Haloferax volcanii]|uniref:Transfer complex protein n=1 Tax=Haloferax volcanii TaxID=2246 RepID=A0A6C0UU69_HALVO|nr:transfer complex protein [Haloferax alexandrinus]QIB79076.1 transfer complex protein [Haloferax alexandrinus]